MKILKLLAGLLGLAILAASAAGYVVWSQAQAFLAERPSEAREERLISIPRGSGPTAVSNLLADNGVVTDAEKFRYLLRFREAAGGLRAGEYLYRNYRF